MFILERMIEGRWPKDVRRNNYDDFSFHRIKRGFDYGQSGDDVFVTYDTLRLCAYTGSKYLHGNELLSYPELTPHLRKLSKSIYPRLAREFYIDNYRYGIEFMSYFFNTFKCAHESFQKEATEVGMIVDDLVHRFGRRKYYPIVDGLVDIPWGQSSRPGISIQGVVWHCSKPALLDDQVSNIERLNVRQLFDIEIQTIDDISVEEVKQGTPFIALRCKATPSHKGIVFWYSLATCDEVTKEEMSAWQMPS